MALSRQDLPVLDWEKFKVFEGAPHGAYRLVEGGDLILVATGAEVHLVLEAAKQLQPENIKATVISMPSFRVFEEHEPGYKHALFPPDIPTISVRCSVGAGLRGLLVDRFALWEFPCDRTESLHWAT